MHRSILRHLPVVLLLIGMLTPMASAQTGACCFKNGTCVEVTALECIQFGGDYQGNGSTCGQVTCDPVPPSGACCLPSGGCTVTTPGACGNASGTYAGDGVACGAVNCVPTGACCVFGTCLDATQSNCAVFGGMFQGNGTTCASVECPGACCFPDGTCASITQTLCENVFGAEFQGAGVSCATVNCAGLIGACCDLPNGGCVETVEADCVALAGTFAGGSTTCDGVCPVCPGDGSCFIDNQTAGCNNADCCAIVCALDSFCCEVFWDQTCANRALKSCDTCPCDLDDDTTVGVSDLLALLAFWGTSGGDCNGDGATDLADLLALLSAWGACP